MIRIQYFDLSLVIVVIVSLDKVKVSDLYCLGFCEVATLFTSLPVCNLSFNRTAQFSNLPHQRAQITKILPQSVVTTI